MKFIFNEDRKGIVERRLSCLLFLLIVEVSGTHKSISPVI